jgi:hypothetical protein
VAGLCTLAEVKLSRRVEGAARDALIELLILDASDAIERYAATQFRIEAAPATRMFDLSGQSLVPIGALSAPPAAIVTGPRGSAEVTSTLTVGTELVLLPRHRPPGEPIWAVELASPPSSGELRITGTWGYPSIPGDVRRAAVETVVEWLKSDQALTRPSPEQFEPGSPPARSLPLKARDLLRHYRVPVVA